MPRGRDRFGLREWLQWRQNYTQSLKEAFSLSQEHVIHIRNHKDTRLIEYPQYSKAYDYVSELFPYVNVRSAKIFAAKRSVLDRLGYKGVGGFYNKADEVIVIPDDLKIIPKDGDSMWSTIVADVEIDEVIVHELLHYVSGCRRFGYSMQAEEEFAYGNSVKYMKGKGKTDDEIIEKVFLPYLIQVVDKKSILSEALMKEKLIDAFNIATLKQKEKIIKKIEKTLFDFTVKKAKNMGQSIIRVYCLENKKDASSECNNARRRFSNIDL
jgi:hypothetical protein